MWSGSSLLICRKRSGRADECSGPWGQNNKMMTKWKMVLNHVIRVSKLILKIQLTAIVFEKSGWFSVLTIPSIPWGSSRTMPLLRTHLAWPELMNWSMIHWAVLWKSPNWASHRIRAFGLAMAKPSSKPESTLIIIIIQSNKMTNAKGASVLPKTPYSDKELLHTV